jgi:hypothetical protein
LAPELTIDTSHITVAEATMQVIRVWDVMTGPPGPVHEGEPTRSRLEEAPTVIQVL